MTALPIYFAYGAGAVALFLFGVHLVRKSQRDRDSAESLRLDVDDLTAFAGKNLKREGGHGKRIENILSGVSRADAGRMLSSFPTPRKRAKAN